MFDEYIKKHNINISDIIDKKNRKFFISDYETEVLLSYIIISVNPFSNIIKKRMKYVVTLDFPDYVEVKCKYEYFYNLFKNDENKILGVLKKRGYSDEFYEKEKEILMTAFLNFHNWYFTPDIETIKKNRSNKMNKDAEIIIKKSENNSSENKDDKETDSISENTEDKIQDDEENNDESYDRKKLLKISYMTSRLTKANYKKANRTLE